MTDTHDRYVVTAEHPTWGAGVPSDAKFGDVLLVEAGREPDSEGDLFGMVESVGRMEYVHADDLTLEATLQAAEIIPASTISIEAVAEALLALGVDVTMTETALRVAKAIEKGVA